MAGGRRWVGAGRCAAIVALIGALAPFDAHADGLRVLDRSPAALLVVTPPGISARAPLADLLEAADAALRAHTRLELRSLEQLGVDSSALDGCRTALRITCWVTTVRGRVSERSPRFVLVLALHPMPEGRERASLLLLDAEEAERLLARANRDDPDWRAAVEDQLFAGIARTPPSVLDLTDPEQRARYFDEAVQDKLRDPIDAAGFGTPLGRVRVQGTLRDWPLRVDGALLGTTTPTETVIQGVPVGPREVQVDVPWGDPARAQITVVANADAVMVIGPPPTGAHPARPFVQWGGVAVAASGVAVLAYGLARGADGTSVRCLRRDGDVGDCPGLGAPTFGYDPSMTPSTAVGDVDPGGLAIAPFGAALVTVGAGAALATWLSADEADFPWWQIAVGIAAGGLTYGVGHAITR